MTDELSIKIRTAIQRIKEHEPPEGYYLAFSGGKDSEVIYSLAGKAGVKFDAHFHRTTVDPPEVLAFIKENYPDVIWDKPRNSMFKLILLNSSPPTRIHRFCCRALKEIGGKGRIVITGIRWQESVNRANRPIFHESNRVSKKFFLNPIIDWSTSDVWDYIHREGLRYCSLYDDGKSRIGCILCPFHNLSDKLDDIRRYPKVYRAYLISFEKLHKKLADRGTLPPQWVSPTAIMEWWIYGAAQDHTTKQEELPEMP